MQLYQHKRRLQALQTALAAVALVEMSPETSLGATRSDVETILEMLTELADSVPNREPPQES